MYATYFHIHKSREIKDDRERLKEKIEASSPPPQILMSLSSYHLVFTREWDHPSVSFNSQASLCKVHPEAEGIDFCLTSFE